MLLSASLPGLTTPLLKVGLPTSPQRTKLKTQVVVKSRERRFIQRSHVEKVKEEV